MKASWFRPLVLLALVWTFCLVVLGAYVRLSDAGLGCPDWPGCFGELTPHHAKAEILAEHAVNPDGPVSLAKAWKEMVHRYFASGLGLVILVIAALAVRHRLSLRQSPALPIGLFFVVCFQGALGAWTVTLLLKPAIVTAHLIGGFTTLGLLGWLAMRQQPWPVIAVPVARLRHWAGLALVVVAIQVTLGGWVSTNYAGVACVDFPTCGGQLVPQMDFADAFHVVRKLGETPGGAPLTLANLLAIHWTHRVGALVILLVVGGLAVALLRYRVLRGWAVALLAVLVAQIALGISIVLLQLPTVLAAAHHAGAASLLLILVAINYRLRAR
jgi:cytochrome c oxidase assembly protein subunit 15